MDASAADRDVTPWLATFIAEESQPDRVEAWVDRTRVAITRDMPELTAYDDLPRVLSEAIREHWRAFLADFGQPELTFHLVEAGRLLAVEVARQRELPLQSLIQIYRLAQMSTWDFITDIVHQMPEDSIDHAMVLIHFWTRASGWIDRSITDSIHHFQSERSRVLAGSEARRYDVVREILAGDGADVRAASAALGGYPMSVHHTAVVMESHDHDAIDALSQLAVDFSRVAAGSSQLVVRTGGRRLWMWLGSAQDTPLASILTLEEEAGRRGILAGVGSPAFGMEGFALSHREALAAVKIGRRDHGPTAIVSFADVELDTLLPCGPGVDRFVYRTLGPLSKTDETTRRIRETIRVYLDVGGSIDETASRMFLHRNSVRYRLTKAEDLLGDRILRLNASLSVALRHFEIYHEVRSEHSSDPSRD